MGDVHEFKRRPSNRGQFTGKRPQIPSLKPGTGKPKRQLTDKQERRNGIVLGVILAVLFVLTSLDWRF